MSENRSGRNRQLGWRETPAVCYNETGLEKRSQGWSLFALRHKTKMEVKMAYIL